MQESETKQEGTVKAEDTWQNESEWHRTWMIFGTPWHEFNIRNDMNFQKFKSHVLKFLSCVTLTDRRSLQYL